MSSEINMFGDIHFQAKTVLGEEQNSCLLSSDMDINSCLTQVPPIINHKIYLAFFLKDITFKGREGSYEI